MRPSRAIQLLLSIIALALPVSAQIKANAGADAAVGGTGQVGSSLNSGGAAATGLPGAGQLSPLPLSLSLPPSALATPPRPAAEETSAPQAAVSPEPPASPSVAPANTPNDPPHFIEALASLGVPAALTERLQAFLTVRHPGEQSKIYHRLKHSQEVADLTARIASDQELSAEKKILLILSAALHDVDPDRTKHTPARAPVTIAYLGSDDAARGLLLDFGNRYGFTAAQVKALIMATDFDLDPAKMQRIQAAFASAAQEAFPAEPDWALNWGKRLAFADQASTYVGSPAEARKRVAGLAVEIRTQLEAIGKGPGPSNEVILAGTYKFLSVLKQNPLFALLPDEQRRNFETVYAYFATRQTPAAWTAESAPAPARAPPRLDQDAAQRYINGIMGGRAPTDREADALLGDWLNENAIPLQSQQAQDIRAALLPAKAGADAATAAQLDPALRRHAALLIRIAAEHRVTVSYVESVIVKRGLLRRLNIIPDASLENQIDQALINAELERAVSAYPKNAQGELMRSVAQVMGTKGGKSLEEISRNGAFLYADFSARNFLNGRASRDPDIQGHTIVFYVTRKDGQWRLEGYRQASRSVTPDLAYINALKAWLRAGGIPSSDFF